MFWTAFVNVAIMMAYVVVGFVLIKTKLIKKESIADFAKLLMYICQPALLIYSLTQNENNPDTLSAIGISVIVITVLFAVFLLVFYLLFRKKYDSVAYRIYTIASCFGNVGFFGIPIVEALLPGYSIALAVSCIYMIVMNEIGWTIGSLIITRDKKYINWKKIFLNPSIVGFVLGLPLFIFNITLPSGVDTVITVLGRLTTPLCMFILGMRLATTSYKVVFCNYRTYLMVLVKQVIAPIILFGVLYFIQIDTSLKQTLFILSAAPIASVVLNYSELVGEGQEEAASLVLCGTLLSIITLPLLMFLI